MKKLSIIITWLSAFLVIGGVSIFQEYFSEHKYYFEMLSTGSNWGLLVVGIICALIPFLYRSIADKFTVRGLGYSIAASMLIFAYAFIAIRDQFVGSAFIALPLNISLMMGSAVLMIGGMWSGGSIIYRTLYRHNADTLDRSVIALVLGFVAALCVSWVLVMTTLLYQVVAVLYLVACGYLIYREHQFLKTLGHNVSVLVNKHFGFSDWSKTLTTILFIVTILYLMYGVMLAFIPYPTAWDANHAYMYIPKIWAEHNGYLWTSLSAQYSPSPWLTYVAVWFQFGYAFKSVGGWIWPDTWAVMMNYLIAVIVVMVMTWGLVQRVITYFNLHHKSKLYHSAWMILISWVTSGMGAFLVFVDNKSDFGILAITLCALVLLFDWLPNWKKDEQENNESHGLMSQKYTIPMLSGLIAGVAVFAKPTSLFDFASIVVLFAGIVAGLWAMVGVGLMTIGAMALMKITTVPLYLSSSAGAMCVLVGVIILVGAILTSGKEKLKTWTRLCIWGVSMLGLLVVLKTPLMIWKSHYIGTDVGGIKGYIQGVLMGYHTEQSKTTPSSPLLLAQTTSTPSRSCTLDGEGLTKDTLYNGTQKATTEGAGEDLGRYIGYGGKTWDKPWWKFLVPDNTCIGFDSDARVLCNARIAINEGKVDGLIDQLKGDSLKLFEQAKEQQKQGLSVSYIQQNLVRQLTLYWQDKILLKSDSIISIPYRWIVPLNITYNRSLQNLSSYYTDIGVVWLILLVILLTATVWLIVNHPRRALIPMTAVIGWIIWWVSGSAIMWYGIGLIVWTMMSMLVIIDAWTRHDEIDEQSIVWVEYVVMGLVGGIMLIQLVLNFIRIGSQGGGGIFVQYKTANGIITNISEQLTTQQKIKYGLSGKDIFDMQFPHYNKTIAAIDANPENKEAVLIAGTYMPYFIRNQYNLINDGFLMSLWEWFSDENICRSYLRLKDKNLTYLVIDPNIASVIMGEGNATLRDRMFAKIDPSTGKIVKNGAISMLANLVSAGYIELFNSNNIAAKYAFTLSDADVMSVFGVKKEDVPLIRTKVATARFWGDEGNTLLQKVLQIMAQRLTGPQGLGDIADIFGKDVDVPKLTAIAQQVNSPAVVDKLKNLTQDERYILANYLTLIGTAQTKPQEYQQQLVSLLQQSIGGGSQLIVFRVK